MTLLETEPPVTLAFTDYPKVDVATPAPSAWAPPGSAPVGFEPEDRWGEVEAEFEELAGRRWEAARDPRVTGIVPAGVDATALRRGVVPFFQSEKAQGMNPRFNQRKMEAFTGAVSLEDSATGTWREKREVGSLFPVRPEGRVTSGGSVASPVDLAVQRERTPAPMLQNNVGPVDPVHVGPGLGNPDVLAFGGFNSGLIARVMPPDLSWRRNTVLEGRPTNAGAPVGKTALPSALQANAPPTAWATSPSDLLPTRASRTGAAVRASPASRGVRRCEPAGYVGAAAGPGGGRAQGRGGAVTTERCDADQGGGDRVLNLRGPGAPGAHWSAPDFRRAGRRLREYGWDVANAAGVAPAPRQRATELVPSTGRELHQAHVLAGAAPAGGGAPRFTDPGLSTTGREVHVDATWGVGGVRGPRAPTVRDGLAAPSTRRAVGEARPLPTGAVAAGGGDPGTMYPAFDRERALGRTTGGARAPVPGYAAAPEVGGRLSNKLPVDNSRLQSWGVPANDLRPPRWGGGGAMERTEPPPPPAWRTLTD